MPALIDSTTFYERYNAERVPTVHHQCTCGTCPVHGIAGQQVLMNQHANAQMIQQHSQMDALRFQMQTQGQSNGPASSGARSE